MTIEIKQLVIRAVVDQGPNRSRDGLPPGARTSPEPASSRGAAAPPSGPGPELEAMVAECTRQVLRELRKRKGR
ncbi:MAG TPA: DUF5908 family protein [Myxococcaceae bacterium]|jgi:hypothetical protein